MDKVEHKLEEVAEHEMGVVMEKVLPVVEAHMHELVEFVLAGAVRRMRDKVEAEKNPIHAVYLKALQELLEGLYEEMKAP